MRSLNCRSSFGSLLPELRDEELLVKSCCQLVEGDRSDLC